MIAIPCHRGARIGIALFVCLWALLGAIEWCRASEVPPVIVVREAMRDARRVLDRKPVAPAHASGGECVALPEVDVEDDIPERVEVERHLAKCSRAGRRSDPWMVLSLVRLERDLGAPAGLLSSAVCWETGYTHGARGDWQDGRARAHGVTQMHGWWRAWCGWSRDMRDDVEAAARCYLSRVLHYLPDAERCDAPWTVAEAMAANGVKYGPWGCAARSKHADELTRWTLSGGRK